MLRKNYWAVAWATVVLLATVPGCGDEESEAPQAAATPAPTPGAAPAAAPGAAGSGGARWSTRPAARAATDSATGSTARAAVPGAGVSRAGAGRRSGRRGHAARRTARHGVRAVSAVRDRSAGAVCRDDARLLGAGWPRPDADGDGTTAGRRARFHSTGAQGIPGVPGGPNAPRKPQTESKHTKGLSSSQWPRAESWPQRSPSTVPSGPSSTN